MASSTGISNIGYASNLDVESIISKMVALETQRKVPLQKAASLTTSRISTVSQLKSLMSTLQDKLTVLADASKWTSAMKANNSNATALSATVSTSTTEPQAMGGTYNIKVDKLATAQNITSGRFATGHTFATGELTITSKDPSKTPITVNIADGASLASVASSINQAGAGVTASILNDGTGERLVLASTATGEKNGFTLSGTGGMAALDYNTTSSAILGSGATGGNVIAAQDAKATINGVEVSSTSNVFASTIQGVSFTALAVGESTLTIASDTDALKTRITEFVTAYNAVNSLLSTSVKYDQDTNVAGVFQADSTMVSLQNAMRSAFAGSATTSTVFNRLIDIGIDMKKGGKLEIDDAKLSKALNTNASEVAKFFAEGTDGLADKLQSYTRGVLSVDGVLETKTTSLKDAEKRNTSDQDKIDKRAEMVEARLRAQYTALDKQMSSLNALNAYVAQQVAQWNKSSS